MIKFVKLLVQGEEYVYGVTPDMADNPERVRVEGDLVARCVDGHWTIYEAADLLLRRLLGTVPVVTAGSRYVCYIKLGGDEKRYKVRDNRTGVVAYESDKWEDAERVASHLNRV